TEPTLGVNFPRPARGQISGSVDKLTGQIEVSPNGGGDELFAGAVAHADECEVDDDARRFVDLT
ncbi:hypothetical protein, partial [Yinghuangia sp. YIM S10712]|uniref:hypothetical protein n=1 Tax=Yinghuangia sp. YIM S10712 TaxID=3436930 RepID=UPI003F533849